MMDVAYRLSAGVHSITEKDIEKLRQDGFTDEQILDIVSAAALRNFFSRTIDALGVEPDDAYRASEPELYEYVMKMGAHPRQA